MKADPGRPLGPNLAVIASYIEADDVVIDVGGGAGGMSLPLALRCREVINVEPSPTMAAGFRTNAARAGITNIRIIEGERPAVDAPAGSVALVNHVTYLVEDGAVEAREYEIVPRAKGSEKTSSAAARSTPSPR